MTTDHRPAKLLDRLWIRLLKLLRLWPPSLASKCCLAFGAAVVLILALALLWPYIWMGQLTREAYLEASRAQTQMVLLRHFEVAAGRHGQLAAIDSLGNVLEHGDLGIKWIRFSGDPAIARPQMDELDSKMIKVLRNREEPSDRVVLARQGGVLRSRYVKIFRAAEGCMGCHNPQGSAQSFSPNQPVGALIINRPAGQIGKIVLMNRLWIIVAGLVAGSGAIVAFYMITQRVILRPIRQLRAMANNVADGNLDIRSNIATGDEYEKLTRAFNHMLDRLQASQEKLRLTNRHLDDKIIELSDRNIELFKANKIKGEFLANISHEFRTPLNAILGFAQILREKPGDPDKEKARRYADNIITSGNRLLAMINDLLEMAKTEAGKLHLRLEKTSVAELCQGAVAQFSTLTLQKKIKTRVVVDDNIPLIVTDAGKLQQILLNFLSNAVKFTPRRGRIEVRAFMPSDNTLRIAVTDTGCGIAPVDKERIFEKFQQADGSLIRRSAGSGLGLAISRELAAMLAGEISLESEPGKGSTFWVDVPADLRPAEQVSRLP